ncbi:DUF5104 domain-containing protein [Mogibacterium diversum]|uniref:DUF5104 domain-containing protein n=1 Tax=Mogibacterium diversum TaxID=114527 RepID=UPI0028D6F388|nr:DUF5104 domain-containing protein [Mogibacterium diversum]
MRKLRCALLCLLMILSTAFCLTGCKSRTDEMAGLEAHTDKQINKMKKQVIKCINKQDKEGLKKLFSKDAQKHIENLDGKLDQLIVTFDGNKIESEQGSGTDFEGSTDAQPLHIYGDYVLKLSNGKEYTLFISFCDRDDENPDKKGLIQIDLRTFSKEETPKGFHGGVYKDDYALSVHTLENAQ